MKTIVPIVVLLTIFAGCSSADRLHKKSIAAIAAKRTGDIYTFKLRPTLEESYQIQLSGVTETSCHLGPDFTVHYFSFPQSGSLAIYFGGHPQTETDRPTKRFRSSFGTTAAVWSLFKRTADFRATTYIPYSDSEGGPTYTWHLIVIANTEKAVHEIVDQLPTFHLISGAKKPKPGP